MNTYYCKRINEYIPVDGRPGKLIWEKAETVSLVDAVSSRQPKQPTGVRMLWNREYLYLRFECTDKHINATMRGYNDHLYDEEVVEVFIDDDNDLKTYIEIEVNPLNALLHYGMQNNLNGRKIAFARVDKCIETAVYRDDDKNLWYAEIAVPFNECMAACHNPPEPGDEWRINLYRIDRDYEGEDEYSAWSPTEVLDFHMPEKFGKIVFTL